MTDEQVKWALNQDWNDDEDIKTSDIAKVIFEVTSRITNESDNNKFKNNFEETQEKIQSLNQSRSPEVWTIFNTLVDKEAKEHEEELLKSPLIELAQTNLHLFEKALTSKTEPQQNKEMICINLAEFYDDFVNIGGSKEVKTATEAFTVVSFIRAHTTGSTKRMLNQTDMKDTNHHNRDKNTQKYKNDSEFIERKTEKEHWDVVKKSIFDSLRLDGTGEDRANRLSTHTVKIIKKIITES